MRRDLGLRDLGGDVSQLDSWKLTIRDGNDTRFVFVVHLGMLLQQLET